MMDNKSNLILIILSNIEFTIITMKVKDICPICCSYDNDLSESELFDANSSNETKFLDMIIHQSLKIETSYENFMENGWENENKLSKKIEKRRKNMTLLLKHLLKYHLPQYDNDVFRWDFSRCFIGESDQKCVSMKETPMKILQVHASEDQKNFIKSIIQ